MKELNIGISGTGYYSKALEEFFPNAKYTEISEIRLFLKGKYPEVDAMVFSTEAAAAWSMLYPQYSAVIPKGMKLKVPVAFSLPKGEDEYARFMNTWLQLKDENGFQQRVYDYWLLGKNPKAKKARWSVAKDVLGWDL